MPTSKPRFDSYANPVAPLVDARTELRYDRAFNGEQRALVAQILEEKYRELLRRGIFADLVVRISIKDGMIMQELHASVDQIVRGDL